MTITTNPARVEYTSSAAQTVFNYTFKIYESTDLNVYVTPVGQAADDATDITTAYTVDPATIGDDAGGFITFTSPLNSGDLVTIVSDIPTDRTVDYQTNGDFSPDTVNNDIDRTVSLVKQVENLATRTVQFQESQQSATGITLPAPSAGDLLIWNATGTGFDNNDGTGLAGIAAAVAETQANVVITNADAVITQADAVTTQADAALTTALSDEFNDIYYGSLASDPATAPSGAASTVGDLYFNTTDSVMYEYTGIVWQEIATAGLPDGSIAEIKLDADLTAKVNASSASASRNQVLNQDPLSQGLSQRVGMSSTTYTGNGTSQSVATGVDMATGDFGGLVWLKDRDIVGNHGLYDSIRGGSLRLQSNATSAEAVAGDITLTATGFDLGTSAYNTNTDDLVAWSFQTTDKTVPTFGSSIVTGDSSTFTSSVGDWTSADVGSSISVEANQLKCINDDASAGLCELTMTTVIGRAYRVTVDVDTSNSDGSARVLGDGGLYDSGVISGSPTSIEVSFVADSTSTNLRFSNGSSATIGHYLLWDNVLVEEYITGVTNRGLPYTAHYNAEMGFSIVGYEGDGLAGHEIPHHLGREPELQIYKDRDNVRNWVVKSNHFDDEDYLLLNTTAALTTDVTNKVTLDALTSALSTGTGINVSAGNVIQYNFATIEGVSKVGKYIGTGAAGNYVPCGFGDKSAGFVLVKGLGSSVNWVILDASRGDFRLRPSASDAESAYTDLEFVTGGFALDGTGGEVNTLNEEYLFLAFADNSGSTGRSQYDYPTTDDTLTIEQDTLISFADGFSANGETNIQENVPAATTMTFGAGSEDNKYYIYKDEGGSYGKTVYRPLEEQDYSGVQTPNQADPNLRTTAKHFDYESSTGVVSASGENSGEEAWRAFDKTSKPETIALWQVTTATTSQLQYKGVEPRVLKSWRMRGSFNDVTRDPRRFTIEGSQDGNTWVAIDSTYTASDYTGGGLNLWGALQSTSGNTTAYLYHRISITANNGHVSTTEIDELEFNTETPSDRYDVSEGVMYNYAGTAINRVYLGELRTDTDGDIINNTIVNYTPNKLKTTDAELQGDLIVRGEIDNRSIDSFSVHIDTTANPPLIVNGYGVDDVVDNSTGDFDLILSADINALELSGLKGLSNNTGTIRPTVTERNKVRIRLYNDAGALADVGQVWITGKGGKS